MERGYTFVMVDLRGFGGSSRLPGLGRPGRAGRRQGRRRVGGDAAVVDRPRRHVRQVLRRRHRADRASLKPAGLGGGRLAGAGLRHVPLPVLQPRALRELAPHAGALHAIAATPGSLQDDPGYNVNGANNTARPGCYGANYLDQQTDDHDSAYWKARDLIAKAKGSKVPLFMTQGFLENNTKPDGALDFFNGVAGPKRAWFGMWDHVRGNDVDENGRLAMGRHGWFDEVMRFYDQLPARRRAGRRQDPPVAVETSDGTWRTEAAVAARRRDRPSPRALQPGSLHRRRAEQRHRRRRLAQRRAASGPSRRRWRTTRTSRACRRSTVDALVARRDANLVADVYDVDSERQGDADQPRHVPAARQRCRSFDLTATTGSSRPAIASACCSPRRTPSGGCTARPSSR